MAGSCTEWCEMSQKNKMQTNTLLGGIVALALGGVYIGSTIFNAHLELQGWTRSHSDGAILLVLNLFYAGAVVGSFTAALLVNRIEKLPLSRVYLFCMGVASILQTIVPKSIVVIGIARVMAGLAFGMAYLVVLVHGGEVLVKELRGIIMASVNHILFVGIISYGLISPIVLYNYNVLSTRIVGIAGITFTLLAFTIGQFMSYESPVFLLQKGRDTEAIRSLMKLRLESTETVEVRRAYCDTKTMLREDSATSRSILADGNWRPLVLTSLGKIAAVLSFNAAVNQIRIAVIDEIFHLGVYSLSSLVILSIRMFFGLIFVYTLDKHGRKSQQTLSTLLSGLLLVSIGIAYLAAETVSKPAAIVAFLCYEVFACAGVTLVPDVHLSEAFSTRKKAISIATVLAVECVTQVTLLSISFTWDFSDPSIYGGVLLSCGLPMMLIAVVLRVMLPETAKLSLRQSRALFARNEAIYETTTDPGTPSESPMSSY